MCARADTEITWCASPKKVISLLQWSGANLGQDQNCRRILQRGRARASSVCQVVGACVATHSSCLNSSWAGLQEEAAYKLCKVKRVQFGKGGVPFLVTHDGRTIRYPDPDIKVCVQSLSCEAKVQTLQPSASQLLGDQGISLAWVYSETSRMTS